MASPCCAVCGTRGTTSYCLVTDLHIEFELQHSNELWNLRITTPPLLARGLRNVPLKKSAKKRRVRWLIFLRDAKLGTVLWNEIIWILSPSLVYSPSLIFTNFFPLFFPSPAQRDPMRPYDLAHLTASLSPLLLWVPFFLFILPPLARGS